MTFFKSAKKKLTNLGNVLNEVVSDIKNEVRDESDMHKAVNDLALHVAGKLRTHQNELPPKTKEAALEFISLLHAALKEDSRLISPHAPQNQYNLAAKTVKLIHQYQPAFQAAPGFWNHLKAHINNFFERFFAIKDLLSVNKTVLCTEQYELYKGTVKDLKAQIEADYQPDYQPRLA